jgi:hypothetical protein
MATIEQGTQFIGFAPTYEIPELRSALLNAQSSAYTLEDIATAAGGGGISANGFTVVGPLMANITLPEDSTVNYTGPLIMGAGYVLTIPTGTTLNIL